MVMLGSVNDDKEYSPAKADAQCVNVIRKINLNSKNHAYELPINMCYYKLYILRIAVTRQSQTYRSDIAKLQRQHLYNTLTRNNKERRCCLSAAEYTRGQTAWKLRSHKTQEVSQ